MATIEVNKDAKLRFLRGLETNLPSTKTDGYVYVTTDTRAMYVDYKDKGSDETKRIRLGDVITVDDLTTLNTQYPPAKALDGILYYCTKENILCTPFGTGAGRQWKQINSQKTLEQIITNITFTATASTDGANMTVKLTGGNQTKSDSLGIASGANVKVGVDAGGKVTIGAKDTTVTGAITTGTREAGGIAINLMNTTGGTDTDGTALKTTSSSGGTIGIVGSGIKVSQDSNVITIDGTLSVANAFDATGQFKTKITNANNDVISSVAVTPTITYGKDADKDAIFKSGTATLDVYSKSEVDDAILAKLRTANAMTFKGTLGASGATYTALPNTASLGDTIIVNDNNSTYDYKPAGSTKPISQICRRGDMFIAGPGNPEDEGVDGLLKNVVWTYVPAGDDEIPSISATAKAATDSAAGDITFKTTLGTQTSTIGTVVAGDGMTATASGTTFTIAHGKVTTNGPTPEAAVTQAPSETKTYTAITGVTIENGHVTDYKTTQLTVVDTTLKDASLVTATATNGATVTLNVKDTANNSKGNAITVKTSGNSAAYVSLEDKAIVIDTVWGTFE